MTINKKRNRKGNKLKDNYSAENLPLELFYHITYERLSKRLFEKGWHYCPEWDYMLVVPDSPENNVCGH